jgi:acylphosphatase
MTPYERIHFYVDGLVQGVSFRHHTTQTASALGVSGWVRNLPDGRVEIYAEGPPAAVTKLLEWAHQGPPSAAVNTVTLRVREPIAGPTLPRFEIR